MILTKQKILEYRDSGQIIIEPFTPALVRTNSVDVRITGPFFRRVGLPDQPGADIVLPYFNQQESRNQYDYIEPLRLSQLKDMAWENCDRAFTRGAITELPSRFGEETLAWYLVPGIYLATTVEAIGTRGTPHRRLDDGTPVYLVPDIDSKSTWGRWGLTVCVCAGRGDVGYCSRWTLEVRVETPTVIIDRTVAGQVRFTEALGSLEDEEVYGAEQDSYLGHEAVVVQLPKSLKVIP